MIALCAGPERVLPVIREALAKGADRAIHVVEDHPEAWDTLAWARLLAAAAETENPDLVLTGLQSDDLGWARPASSWPNCCACRTPRWSSRPQSKTGACA